MTSNIHYSNRELEGAHLALPKGAIYWLGPNVTFRHCTLSIGVRGRWLTLMSGRLIDCTIEAKRELDEARWTTMNLKNCRFKGRFSGNEFGYREEYLDEWKLGGIEGCDFSEAQLDLCRFHNCDMRTIQLPKWPSFTIPDPIKHGPELLSVKWPGDFTPVALEGPLQELPSTSALAFHAPTEAKRSGSTLEEFRAVVERFDFILR